MATIQRPSKTNTFLGKLFQARDVIHLSHLKTTSYAQHKALDDFYSGILGLVDGLVESIQGVYGLQDIVIPEAKVEDPVGFLSSFYSTTLAEGYNTYPETWIKNQIDEISQLTASTLYKLKNLS